MEARDPRRDRIPIDLADGLESAPAVTELLEDIVMLLRRSSDESKVTDGFSLVRDDRLRL